MKQTETRGIIKYPVTKATSAVGWLHMFSRIVKPQTTTQATVKKASYTKLIENLWKTTGIAREKLNYEDLIEYGREDR